jgi:hypothetical protein
MSNGLALDSLARSPDVAGPLRRKIASLAGRCPAAFNLSTRETDGLERKRRSSAFPIQHRLTGTTTAKGLSPHHGELEGKIFPGQPLGEKPLEGQGTPRVGVTFGCGRQRSVRLTPSHLRGARKDLLAGYERFSEGVTEQRDSDLSVIITLTTGLSRHKRFDPAQQNQVGQRLRS